MEPKFPQLQGCPLNGIMSFSSHLCERYLVPYVSLIAVHKMFVLPQKFCKLRLRSQYMHEHCTWKANDKYIVKRTNTEVYKLWKKGVCKWKVSNGLQVSEKASWWEWYSEWVLKKWKGRKINQAGRPFQAEARAWGYMII